MRSTRRKRVACADGAASCRRSETKTAGGTPAPSTPSSTAISAIWAPSTDTVRPMGAMYARRRSASRGTTVARAAHEVVEAAADGGGCSTSQSIHSQPRSREQSTYLWRVEGDGECSAVHMWRTTQAIQLTQRRSANSRIGRCHNQPSSRRDAASTGRHAMPLMRRRRGRCWSGGRAAPRCQVVGDGHARGRRGRRPGVLQH